MDNSPDPEQLAKLHAYWRRRYNRVWLALTLISAGLGVVVWCFTRNVEHLYSGLFYAFFPFIGLIYNHFFLFNPQRNSIETQRRMEKLYYKQQKSARTVALINGSMLLIASPLLVVVGMCAGWEYGFVGVVIGGIAGAVGFVGGMFAIGWCLWSGRKGH